MFNHLQEVEERNGFRLTWNTWSSSRLEANHRNVVPIACLLTPMKYIEEVETKQLEYLPVECTSCHLILNPYAPIDFNSKTWTCCVCFTKNELPIQYRGISANLLPAEVAPTNTTVEYVFKTTTVPAPIFLFVIDTCADEKEMQAIKDSVLAGLGMIPENSVVGLITFGPMVHLYELSFQHCPKALIFRGSKELTIEQIRSHLGLPARGLTQQTHNKFLRPLSEVVTHLENIIEELPREHTAADSDHFPLRATGTALGIALGLLADSFPGQTARVIAFLAGTATIGPGMIASDDLRELARSHSDITRGKAKYLEKATQYYNGLAAQAIKNNHIVDVFSFSFFQTGILEMRELIRSTGGILARGDNFDSEVFRESYRRRFKPPVNPNDTSSLDLAINGTLSVVCSRYLKIAGVIGPCAGLPNNTAHVSDENKIGVSGTSKFKILSLDRTTTLAIYFDVANQHQNQISEQEQGIIQCATLYSKLNGKKVLRVTTIARKWINEGPKPGLTKLDILSGFDQEAAAVIMARSAIWRAENEDAFDTVRWIDRNLIKLVQKFADYTPGNANHFVLHAAFSYFPGFMFHFRRSPFIQTLGDTPDETSFFRLVLNRETVENSLAMIQPTLEKFSLNEENRFVELSYSSLVPNAVYLLDTYFCVLVMKGSHIKDWVDKGYDKSPDYENLRQLLRVPVEQAEAICKSDRFPMPKYFNVYERDPQVRYLLTVLDNDNSRKDVRPGTLGGGSDDVSFTVFYDHLKKLAVAPS